MIRGDARPLSGDRAGARHQPGVEIVSFDDILTSGPGDLRVFAEAAEVHVALSTVVPIKSVPTIVTDPSAGPVEVERISREGVEVILVEPDVSAPAGEDGATRRATRACGSHMTSVPYDLSGVSKLIIAMLHLPGLPGRPQHDRAGMRPMADTVARVSRRSRRPAWTDAVLRRGDQHYQIGVSPVRAAEFMTTAKRARESGVTV